MDLLNNLAFTRNVEPASSREPRRNLYDDADEAALSFPSLLQANTRQEATREAQGRNPEASSSPDSRQNRIGERETVNEAQRPRPRRGASSEGQTATKQPSDPERALGPAGQTAGGETSQTAVEGEAGPLGNATDVPQEGTEAAAQALTEQAKAAGRAAVPNVQAGGSITRSEAAMKAEESAALTRVDSAGSEQALAALGVAPDEAEGAEETDLEGLPGIDADNEMRDMEVLADDELDMEIQTPIESSQTAANSGTTTDAEGEVPGDAPGEAPLEAPLEAQEEAREEAVAEAGSETLAEVAQQLPGAAQSARQSYQQTQIPVDKIDGEITLADLDLSSGDGFQSLNSRDSMFSTLMSLGRQDTHAIAADIRTQVAQNVLNHLQEDLSGEKLTLKLNPGNLGQVEVQFQAVDDKLNIVMSADGERAEKALQEGTRELADSIGEKSSRFNVVDVRVDGRSTEPGRQDTRQQDTRQQDTRQQDSGQQDSRRERDSEQQQQQQNQQQGLHQQHNHPHQTGAGEWAAFHLGG